MKRETAILLAAGALGGLLLVAQASRAPKQLPAKEPKKEPVPAPPAAAQTNGGTSKIFTKTITIETGGAPEVKTFRFRFPVGQEEARKVAGETEAFREGFTKKVVAFYKENPDYLDPAEITPKLRYAMSKTGDVIEAEKLRARELWQMPNVVVDRGEGDCIEFSSMRVGAIRRGGGKAEVLVVMPLANLFAGIPIVHAIVEHEDGHLSDPSLELGMLEALNPGVSELSLKRAVTKAKTLLRHRDRFFRENVRWTVEAQLAASAPDVVKLLAEGKAEEAAKLLFDRWIEMGALLPPEEEKAGAEWLVPSRLEKVLPVLPFAVASR